MPLIKTSNILLSMRNNTQRIYERLSRGEFLSVDSSDTSIRHLYEDIEENFDDYADFFKEIGLQLEAGNGYFYFSRIGEGKQSIEQKLESFSKWLDYLDFLKTYDTTFDAGTQFSLVQMEVKLSTIPGLKEKLAQMFPDKSTNRQKLETLAAAMESMGIAEMVNEADGTYQVTNAFHYIEQIILCINIDEDVKDEIPQ